MQCVSIYRYMCVWVFDVEICGEEGRQTCEGVYKCRLVGFWALWHINHCRLSNAKSIFM